MRTRTLPPLFVLALAAAPADAGEFRVGVGPLLLAEDGADLHLEYRPDRSRWSFGYRYARWTDTFDDPFTGTSLTRSTTTLSGPTLSYHFDVTGSGWYLGGSILKASRTERAQLTGEEDSDSVTALFFGGGYTGSIGRSGYYDVGLYVSPGTQLTTRTSVSSEEDSGLFDARLMIGLSF